MKVIGITGGIASGKSYISNLLISMGYIVIDCDKIVHDLLLNKDVIENIKQTFGLSVIANENVDRKKLGKIIFNNKNEELKLNSIIHPLVIDEVNNRIRKTNEDIVFVDVPLLYEANMEYIMDKVIVVYVDKPTQLLRLMSRDSIDSEFANKKISIQMSLEEKVKKADYIIDNSKDFLDSQKQLYEILRRIRDEI